MKTGVGSHTTGDKFESFILIKAASRGVASNGKPFLTLIFRDQTGEIEAKLWDVSKEDESLFSPEKIVRISGEIIQFRGKDQLKIIKIRQAEPTDNVHVSDFIEKAPISKEKMMDKLTETIFEMENPILQRIVRAFIKKHHDDLMTYPAASKNHHKYASGLAHHITSMLAIAKELCELYPQLNRDLLYAGVILHDLGKIKELSGIVSTSYTIDGKLLGHIPMMIEEIGVVARELDLEAEEEVLILQHLVLSHHGKAEWGSPKPPLVQEAEVLHLIDLIDAKMNILNRALIKVKPGEFTERLFPMDNRSFYKPSFETE